MHAPPPEPGSDAPSSGAGAASRRDGPCTLREVLSALPQLADTRFGRYCRRRIPADRLRRALLLLLCGYEVRLHGDTIELRASGWIPALMPRAEPVASYLRKQCLLLPPPLAMDPDNPGFDALFPDADAQGRLAGGSRCIAEPPAHSIRAMASPRHRSSRATAALLLLAAGCSPAPQDAAATTRVASIRVAGFVEAAGIT